MNAELALTVALHRIRHRLSEPGYTSDPCGACKSEAASLLKAMPEGWAVVDLEEWRKEQGSKAQRDRRYAVGVADGIEQERERVRAGLAALLP